MKIGIYISELLYDHDNVILPGFGMFSTEYIPARFIPEEKKVESPSKVISFNHQIKEGDTPLIGHIASHENMDHDSVWRFVREFVEEMYQSLNSGNKVQLDKVGVFSRDADGAIVFEPDTSINYLADASGLSSVNEPGKSEGDAAYIPPAAAPQETPKGSLEPEVDSEEPVVDPVPEVGEPISETHQAEARKQKSGLPPALRWVAYTVVPLLVIIIILAFNFRYFFGEDGLFRASDRRVETEQVTTPQPVPPTQAQPAEEAPEVTEEVQPEPFDPTVQPPRPETGRPVYYIIAGSFENEHQAEAFAEDLRRKGAQTAGIYMRTPAGFYRVAYGYYYDLQEAESKLPEVQQEVNPNAWILHR